MNCPYIRAALAPCFFDKVDIGKNYSPINGLAHVVNGEAGSGHRHESFHLYACRGFNLNLRFNIDSTLFFKRVEIDLNMR